MRRWSIALVAAWLCASCSSPPKRRQADPVSDWKQELRRIYQEDSLWDPRGGGAFQLDLRGEDIRSILKLLNGKEEFFQFAAARAIRHPRESADDRFEKAIPTLRALLRSPNRQVRDAAFNALLGMRTREALPALLDVLQIGGSMARRWTIYWIADLGQDAEIAIPALLRAEQDGDARVRKAAAWALRGIGYF